MSSVDSRIRLMSATIKEDKRHYKMIKECQDTLKEIEAYGFTLYYSHVKDSHHPYFTFEPERFLTPTDLLVDAVIEVAEKLSFAPISYVETRYEDPWYVLETFKPCKIGRYTCYLKFYCGKDIPEQIKLTMVKRTNTSTSIYYESVCK